MNGELMEKVRAAVRPVITLTGWGALLFLVLSGQKVPEWFGTTVVGLTSWWFATRQTEERKP